MGGTRVGAGRATQIQLPVGKRCPKVREHQSSPERTGKHPQKPGVDEHLKNAWLNRGQVHKSQQQLKTNSVHR